MKYFIFLVFAVELTAGSVGVVGCGEHPNFTAQIPCGNLSNLSGVIPEAIAQEFPQNRFVFSDQWVGYLDPVLPALQIIWTTRWTEWVVKEEPNFERFVPPPPPPPCITGCDPPPPPPPPPSPAVEVPEGNQVVLVFAGLILIVYLYQSQSPEKRR